MKSAAPPVVLVPACNKQLGDHPFHTVGRKYVDAVRLAGALPLVLPRLLPEDVEAVLDLADGVLLTGSVSNVHPARFGEAVDVEPRFDPDRDDGMLALIPRVLARGIPLLAICRGLQEVNVALGGTLHQAVHRVPGLTDHRDDPTQTVEQRYGPAHRVEVVPGGVLEAICGSAGFEVNSLHGQGVNRLAPGLRVEAVAPDGLVEAFSAPAAPGFNLCVQWHPEWRAAENPVSMRLLQAFGAAAAAYCGDRVRGPLPARARAA